VCVYDQVMGYRYTTKRTIMIINVVGVFLAVTLIVLAFIPATQEVDFFFVEVDFFFVGVFLAVALIVLALIPATQEVEFY